MLAVGKVTLWMFTGAPPAGGYEIVACPPALAEIQRKTDTIANPIRCLFKPNGQYVKVTW